MKTYIVVTYHVNEDAVIIDSFETMEDAKNCIDERSSAQVQISSGVLIEKYGDGKQGVMVPYEYSRHFWGVGEVLYGTCVATGLSFPSTMVSRSYRMLHCMETQSKSEYESK